MANSLPLNQAGVYVEDFANGQAASGGSPPYTTYATDMDTNFGTLRTTINQMVAELVAVQGPTATVVLDTLYMNRPGRSGGTLTSGILGIHSYLPTLTGGAGIDVAIGDAIVAGIKVSAASGLSFSVSGATGPRWIKIDTNGTASIATAAATGALDLYSFDFTSPSTIANLARLAEPMFDGDDYELCRERPVNAPAFAAVEFDGINERLESIEALLAGLTVDATGGSIGPLAIDTGTVSNPALVVAGRTDVGLYSATNNALSLATNGNEVMRLDGVEQIQTAGVFRVQGVRAATQAITTVTATLIDFDEADTFDIGTWHDHASGTLSDRQEFTVPTGGDGLYLLAYRGVWAAAADGYRRAVITVDVGGGGVDQFWDRRDPSAAGVTEFTVCGAIELDAGDVVRVEVEHSSATSPLNISSSILTIARLYS